jgi:hypothetical protein
MPPTSDIAMGGVVESDMQTWNRWQPMRVFVPTSRWTYVHANACLKLVYILSGAGVHVAGSSSLALCTCGLLLLHMWYGSLCMAVSIWCIGGLVMVCTCLLILEIIGAHVV